MNNDMQDRQDKQDNAHIHSELTEIILGCCFDVMNELGVGFLESVYKNALLVNFGKRKIEFKRLHHPDYPAHPGACDPAYLDFVMR